eukprot:2792334-Pleurochrysis_carterae.AAC.10
MAQRVKAGKKAGGASLGASPRRGGAGAAAPQARRGTRRCLGPAAHVAAEHASTAEARKGRMIKRKKQKRR